MKRNDVLFFELPEGVEDGTDIEVDWYRASLLNKEKAVGKFRIWWTHLVS